MKVLVIGSGGREHALVWKIAQSEKVTEIFCAPGNAGIKDIAECINIKADDINKLLGFALDKKIDLTVVGPEVPLVNGIVDKFTEKGLKIFGPNKECSTFEGSKIYSKEFMEKYDIPTAAYYKSDNIDIALKSLNKFSYPLVIKADGLAAGKGVVICNTKEEAEETISDMMENHVFGNAGNEIVIEEFLEGIEISLLCLVSGEKIIPLEGARDYKKALNDDLGLNTGGMGCFSPNPILTHELMSQIEKEILNNIIIGFKKDNLDYKGILFIGLMITNKGPKVLEFNVRFGDPETEVVLPRLESDIIEIFEKTIDGSISKEDLVWSEKNSLCVIATSGGYPVSYKKGKTISGLSDIDKDTVVFHAGTKEDNENIVTNGGRVLCITALEDTLEDARNKVYNNMKKVSFENMHYRDDIGEI